MGTPWALGWETDVSPVYWLCDHVRVIPLLWASSMNGAKKSGSLRGSLAGWHIYTAQLPESTLSQGQQIIIILWRSKEGGCFLPIHCQHKVAFEKWTRDFPCDLVAGTPHLQCQGKGDGGRRGWFLSLVRITPHAPTKTQCSQIHT